MALADLTKTVRLFQPDQVKKPSNRGRTLHTDYRSKRSTKVNGASKTHSICVVLFLCAWPNDIAIWRERPTCCYCHSPEDWWTACLHAAIETSICLCSPIHSINYSVKHREKGPRNMTDIIPESKRIYLNSMELATLRSSPNQRYQLPNYWRPLRDRGIFQTRSPLFALPAELQLMIFRKVIRHDKYLSLDPERAKRDGTQKFLRQAWNFLTSCQQVLDEGGPVFYSENTVELNVDRDGVYNLMRTTFKLPRAGDWEEVTSGAANFSLAGGVAFPSYIADRSIEASFAFRHDLLVLNSFSTFHLEISDATPFKVYFVCLALGEQVLTTKNVRLSLLTGDTLDLALQLGFIADPAAFRAKLLRACQVLRCGKFSFTGNDNVKKLTKVIEGPSISYERQPVLQLRTFHEYLDATVPGNVFRNSFESAYNVDFIDLHDALLNNDMKIFFEKLSVLYAAAKEEGLRRIERQEAKAQTQLDDRIFEVDWWNADLSDDEDEEE